METRKAEFRLTHMTAEELLACCDAAQASKRDSKYHSVKETKY